MLEKKYAYPILLSFIWLICIVIVNPIGDFPLNDDWSYAKNVKSLVEENKIFFDDWGAMTLIVHTLWGALFCKIFGFSFTVLRFSTLVLGWVGLQASYLLFAEGGLKKKQAFWAALLVGFNPFYFANAFSYMTEVPFLAFLLLAAYFALKSLHHKENYNIALTAFFATLATLIRQPGILVPLAFMVIFIIKNKLSLKTVLQGVMPSIVTIGSMVGFTYWREKNYGLSKNFASFDQLLDNVLSGKMMEALMHKAHGFFVLWGLFLIPLLIILLPYFWKKIPLIGKVISIAVTLFIAQFYYPRIEWAYLGNTFSDYGMGLIVLPFTDTEGPPRLHENDWHNVLWIGFFAGTVLLQWILIRSFQVLALFKNRTSDSVNWSTAFALATALGYFLFLILNNFYFDRYNLIAVPFLVLLIAPKISKIRLPKIIQFFAALPFLLIVVFSIGATHDYLSWNRARWKAINHGLDNLKLPPTAINGGFEYKYSNGITSSQPAGWMNLESWEDENERYLVSFAHQCKYETELAVPYTVFLPPRRDTILFLKKGNVTPTDTLTSDLETLSADGNFFLTNKKTIQLQNTDTRDSTRAHSGKYSVVINQPREYALTFTLENLQPCEKILVTVWKYPSPNMVQSILYSDGKYMPNINYHYFQDAENGWVKMMQEFTIPANHLESKGTFYFYNRTEEQVWFDDFTIIRMR